MMAVVDDLILLQKGVKLCCLKTNNEIQLQHVPDNRLGKLTYGANQSCLPSQANHSRKIKANQHIV